MRSINLDQLRTFIEVVERGNFSAAGRQLNLTQPAVSLHVRELEQRFGVRLLERVGRQAYATEPGRDLMAHAQRIFRDCEEIESSMRRFRDGWLGRVRIGTTLTALTYALPPILRKIRTEFPSIDLLVTNMPTRDSIENLLKNAIDLALVTLPIKEPRVRVTPLLPEVLVAILPTEARNVPDVITPAYVATQSLVLEHERGAVYALVTQWLAEELPLPGRPMLLGTVEAMKTVVSLGLGMSIVPNVAVAEPVPNIIVRPLEPEIPCTLGLVERINAPKNPALDIVRAALLELKVII